MPQTKGGARGTVPHLETVASHMAAVLGDGARVEAAYRSLLAEVGQDADLDLDVHVRLASLLRQTRSRAAPVLFRLLSDRVRVLPDPGSLLIELLACGPPTLQAEALDLAIEVSGRGGFKPDLDLAVAVGQVLDGGGPDLPLKGIGQLLAALQDPRLPISRGDPIGRLLEPSVPTPVRLAAALVLDTEELPAPGHRAVRVLGERAARSLEHYLAYTRATHQDLVTLSPGPEPRVRSLESILDAEAVLGRDRLAATIAQLGWARVADALEATPIAMISIEGSAPFSVRPWEVRFLKECADTTVLWTGWVVVARGRAEATAEAAASDGSRIALFRSHSLDHAELLGEILEVAPVTPSRARRILALLERVVRDYVELFAAIDPEAVALPQRFETLQAEVVEAIAAAPDPGVPLPLEVAYTIQAFEEPGSLADVRTLHGLKRLLHQRGLRHAFRLFGSGGAANRSVDLLVLRNGHPPSLVQRIRYIDFEDQDGHAVPPAVRLVTEAYRDLLLHGQTSLPAIRILVYGTETQMYISFRNHPAFVRLDLSPPRRGGMIDLEYFAVSQYELTQHPDLSVPGIQRLLRRLGFFVALDGTRLHARYDKERAVDLSDVLRHAGLLLRAMPRLMDFDWTLAGLDRPVGESQQHTDRWADFLVRHGLLLPPSNDPPDLPSADLIDRLRAGLGSLGILPAARPTGRTTSVVGQQDLRRLVLHPLRDGLRRGELVGDPSGRLENAPRELFRREHEARRLACLLSGPGRRLHEAIRTAMALRPLERWLRFTPAGTVGGYLVDRAALALRDDDVTVAVLRDDRGIGRLAFATRGGAPFISRPDRQSPWRRPAELTLPELLRELVRDNYRSPGPEGRPGRVDRPATVRALFRSPNPRPPTRPLPGDRCVGGLPAAPGRAAGPVRMGVEGRDPSDFQGAVMVARTVQPADTPRLQRAAAIVSTGGGTLSHVGLLALELGKPSLIVPGHWRVAGDGEDVLVVQRTELRERAGRIRGLVVRCWERVREHELEIREGDLVVVDARDGTLRVLGAERDALMLHQGLADLERASRAIDSADNDADLLFARGALLRVMHQLDRAILRLGTPVLAHYAVDELVAAQTAPGAGSATRQRRRLLDALRQSPRVGQAARTAWETALIRSRDQLRGLIRGAGAAIPNLDGPLQVIATRLAVVRLRDGLLSLADLAPDHPIAVALGLEADAARSLDSLARRRLLELRAHLVDELRPAGRSSLARARSRYVLQAIRWIDDVAPEGGRDVQDEAVLAIDADSAGGALATLATRLVVSSDEAGGGLEAIIGPKAANMGELGRALPHGSVPPWFVLTRRAFEEALQSPVPPDPVRAASTLGEAIRETLARADLEVARRAAVVRALWLRATLSPELESAIVTAYARLGEDAEMVAPSVAVRSSALAEDSPTATWAGQFDTFLFVSGEAAVLHHVRLAWAGLWNARTLGQRGTEAAPSVLAAGGVIVQRMVNSRVSGVVLTADVAGGDMRELVINAGLGLGEGIVSGTVAADEIHVARKDHGDAPLRLRYRVADKRDRLAEAPGTGHGTRRVETLFHQRLRPALEYTEVETLVEAALTVEAHFREPMDIEFAFEDAALRILQARPIPLFRAALAATVQRFPLTEPDHDR